MRISLSLAVLAALLLVGIPPTLVQAESPMTTGRITAVTVYQGQALVTRAIDVPATDGLVELVVTGLPEFVIPGSIYAEPVGDGVEVRSVRYRTRPVETDVREEVRTIDAQLRELAAKQAAIDSEQHLIADRWAYLDKLQVFSAVTADQELRNGVLNASTLQELTKFIFTEREAIAKRQLELKFETEDNVAAREQAQRERDQLAQGSARTVREAVVFVSASGEGAKQLRVRYLVSNATWSPSYNVRVATDRGGATVEYNASIEQRSGEDWNDVSVSLSTATPNLLAQAPKLDSLVIRLGQSQPDMSQVAQQLNMPVDAVKSMEEAKEALSAKRSLIANNRGTIDMYAQSDMPAVAEVAATPASGGAFGGRAMAGDLVQLEQARREASDRGLNEIASQLQVLDYNLARIETKRVAPTTLAGEGVSVTYNVGENLTLPSRADRQLIQIARHTMAAEFYLVATPVLTSFVYEEALVTNTSTQVLLAGPTSTFVGDEFVGRGELPMIAVGETFRAGLGIDSRLRVGRELVDKRETIQGGNRQVSFDYELTLENFGEEPANVRLLDRIPAAGQTDIKITLLEPGKALSTDEAYLLKDRKDGILRWDLTVAGKSVATKREVLKYTMQIEYDKQLAIEGMPTSP